MKTVARNRKADVRSKIEGGFWFSYQKLVRERVIPYQWRAMNDEIPGAPPSHSVGNFRVAAGKSSGRYEGMVFQDSDLYKWLEAVGNTLIDDPPGTEQMQRWAEEAIGLVAASQLPDGYLNTYFIVNDRTRRWKNLRDAHELYCAGHLIEAAVALARSGPVAGTIGDTILGVARKLADLIDATFGRENGKIRGIPGHEEIELALIKLYRVTGERRYLNLARYFVDERGSLPSHFETEARAEGYVSIYGAKALEYYQAHAPVREQTEAVGHAVRAMYLYIALADLALETDDSAYVEACDRLWGDTTERKMYLTGGIGASEVQESFSAAFDLPSDTAYAETCAAIGLFLFSSRMLRLHDEAKYADVMERCLYNGIISGLALDGESYFYVNPLEVYPAVCDNNASYRFVKYRRQPWYGCACCPPNIARTIAGAGEHMYHLREDCLYADLYHEGSVAVDFGGGPVEVVQRTRYPWTGEVRFEIRLQNPQAFGVALRRPGWCRTVQLAVAGNQYATDVDPDGYIHVSTTWTPGDKIELTLSMPV